MHICTAINTTITVQYWFAVICAVPSCLAAFHVPLEERAPRRRRAGRALVVVPLPPDDRPCRWQRLDWGLEQAGSVQPACHGARG